MTTSDQTTTGDGGQGQGQGGGFALDPAAAPSAAPSTQPGPPGETSGSDRPTEPTASPGPTVQSTDTRPSDAPMPGTGPTQTVEPPPDAPASSTDPFDGAELVEVGPRGFTFRQTFDDGGVGLITLGVTLADQGGGTFGLTLAHPNQAGDDEAA